MPTGADPRRLDDRLCHAQSRGRRPVDRLQELRRRRPTEHSNELATYRDLPRASNGMKEENLAYLDQRQAARQARLRHGRPGQGQHPAQLFRHRPPVPRLPGREERAASRVFTRRACTSPSVIEHELTQLPDVYYVLAWNFKNEILANNQPLLERGVEFYFPVNPKDA